MDYKALYRKHRPTCFKDLVGQEKTIQNLKNSIKNNKIGHAYILHGPKGIGKTTIAKIFAKAINCKHNIDGDCCNQCESCKMISENRCSEVLELDAASNNGVEDVRNIISLCSTRTHYIDKKVFIVDEAHMLTKQAWNALLKTVEEPPENVVFLFVTTEYKDIPETIKSRCQKFNFNKLSEHDLVMTVSKVAKEENIKISIPAITKIVKLAKGHARDALNMLEQVSNQTDDVDESTIKNHFGLIDNEEKIKFFNFIINKDIEKSLNWIKQQNDDGIDFIQLYNDLLNLLIEKIILLQTNNEKLLKEYNKNELEQIPLDETTLFSFVNTLNNYFSLLNTTDNPIFCFQQIIFALCNQVNNVKPNIIPKKTEVINQNKIVKEETVNSIAKTPTKIEVEKTVVKPTHKTISQEHLKHSFEEVIGGILCNCKPIFLNEANTNIQKLVDSGIIDELINNKGVKYATKNAYLVLFEHKIETEHINEKLNDSVFNEKIKKILGNEIKVMATTIKELPDLVNKIKELKASGKNFNEYIPKKEENAIDIYDSL